MKTLSLTKCILILLFFTIGVSKGFSATYYSTGASNWRWSSTTSWTSNSNGSGNCSCIPAPGDIIVIRSTDSISVPDNINVAGDLIVNVYGELNITGFLDLNGTSSVVNIYPGASLTSNGSNSSKLRIGGTATAEYSGNDGNKNGPWTISNGYSGTNSALPVVLTDFSGVYSNSGIVLQWETSQETGHSHFEVQRSSDGQNFTTIATLPGSNSTSGNTYNHIDNHAATVNYYRLLQTDTDGNSAYSSIIEVSNAVELTLAVSPNPSQGNNFRIAFGDLSENAVVVIKDSQGKEVFNRPIEGNSVISGQDIPEALSPGVYVIIANNGTQIVTQKIIIQ